MLVLLSSRRGVVGDEKAATMIEFSIVAGLLLMLLFGVFTFARALAAHIYITEAFEKAVRDNFVRGQTCGVELSSALSAAAGSSFLGVTLEAPLQCVRRNDEFGNPSNYCLVSTTVRLPCELCSMFGAASLSAVPLSTAVYLEESDRC